MSNYKEVRAKTGEDRDGKAIYRTIGRVMETKNGPMLKLDTLPLQWDGWAYLSEPKPKDEAPPARDTRSHAERKRPDFSDYDRDGAPPF